MSLLECLKTVDFFARCARGQIYLICNQHGYELNEISVTTTYNISSGVYTTVITVGVQRNPDGSIYYYDEEFIFIDGTHKDEEDDINTGSYFNTGIKFIDEHGNISYGAWGHDDPTGDFIPDDPDVETRQINYKE
jgi:hypothetical protein